MRSSFVKVTTDDRMNVFPQFTDPGAITRFSFSNGRFRVHGRQLPSRTGSRKIETVDERLVELAGILLRWPTVATFDSRVLSHARIDTGTRLGH